MIASPALAGVLAAAAIVLAAVGWRSFRSDAVEHLDIADLVLLREQERRDALGMGPLDRIADRLVPTLRRSLPEAWLSWLQRQVDLGGRPAGVSLDSLLRRFAAWLILVSPLLIIFLFSASWLGVLACVAVVIMLPLVRLSRAKRLRQEQIQRDLPDFLDIVSVTVTAGVAFRAALGRVAERFGGPLGEEIALTIVQLESGASLRQAFENLRLRNDSESLSDFVTAYLQSEELGAPPIEALNQIAVDMRRDNAQRMRRQAARAAPRVTLITSLVLVPGALILVIVGLFLGSDINLDALRTGR